MKHATKFTTFVAVSALALAGCVLGNGPINPDQLETTIKVMVPSYTLDSQAGWEQVVKEYNREYPKVTVKLDIEEWKGYREKVRRLIHSGHYPDILVDNGFAHSADKKLLYPIADVTSWSTPNSIETALLKNGQSKDGTQWALPTVVSSRLLIYNQNLVDQASILKLPKTWTQLDRDCKKIKVASPAIYPYGMPLGKEASQDEASAWVRGANGSWTINHQLTPKSSGTLEAFTQMKKLITEGCTQPNPGTTNREEAYRQFQAGQIVMMIGDASIVTQTQRSHPEVKVDAIPIPSKDGTGFSIGVTDFIMAFNNNDDTRKQAVKGFLDFFYSNVSYRKWYVTSGLLPVTREIIAESKAKSDNVGMKFYDALRSVRFLPVNDPQWDILQSVLQNGMGKLQTQPPEKVAEELQTQMSRENETS